MGHFVLSSSSEVRLVTRLAWTGLLQINGNYAEDRGMLHRRIGVGLLALLAICIGARADEIAVGDLGAPRRLEIRGAKILSPEKIKTGLVENVAVRLAAHPLADAVRYTDTLRQRAQAGYRQAGFPDALASIAIDFPSRRLVLTIDEGPRYKAAAVRVEGAVTVPVDRLIERLTSPYPPKNARVHSFVEQDGKRQERLVDLEGNDVKLERPVWQRDAWAQFPAEASIAVRKDHQAPVAQARSALERQVADALADLGYYFAIFDVEVARDDAAKTADLVLRIRHEGPSAEIGRIDVDGNERDSREEILAYLELAPGQRLSRDRLAQLQQRLWASARYIKSEVRPIMPVGVEDKLLVRIDLLEYPSAPKLDHPLSQEEQIMLRCRDWLADRQKWDGDLVWQITGPEGSARFVIARQRGVVGRIAARIGEGAEPTIDHAMVFAPDESMVCSQQRKCKLAWGSTRQVLTASLSHVLAAPYNAESPFNFNVGVGFSSPGKNDSEPTFRFRFGLQPAAFVAMVHERLAKAAVHEGVLTIERGSAELWRIEAASGRLIEFRLRSAGESAKELCLRSEPGAYQRELTELRRTTAEYVNVLAPQRPLSSLLLFLSDEPLVVKAVGDYFQDDRPLRLFGKLIEGGALEPLDALVRTDDEDEEDGDEFRIPWLPGDDELNYGHSDPRMWAYVALKYGDRLFPYGTWPAILAQETSLTVLGKSQYGKQVCGQLYETHGPLCMLAMASLLERVDKRLAARAANRGLERLSVERFRDDCRPLFDGDYLVGRCLQQTAIHFRQLADDDIRLLAQRVDGRYQEYLEACYRVLRGNPDRAIDEVLPELFEALWQAGLRDELEAGLSGIRDRTSPPADAP
jgi:hypothetical protein